MWIKKKKTFYFAGEFKLFNKYFVLSTHFKDQILENFFCKNIIKFIVYVTSIEVTIIYTVELISEKKKNRQVNFRGWDVKKLLSMRSYIDTQS